MFPRIFLRLLLVPFFLIIIYPDVLHAQGSLVRYFDKIEYDEEWNRIVRPSFAMSEPVMDEIYMIDGNGRIIIYSSDLFPLYSLGKSDKIERPEGLAVDTDGNLYVAQAYSDNYPRNRISVFNPCLKWMRDIYLEGFEGAGSFIPYRLAFDKNKNLYVAGIYSSGVLVLDNNFKLIDIMSPEEDEKKVKLVSVSIDDSGWIYLVSEETGHIYVYDENRKYKFQFGEKGGSSGKLSRPRAAAIDNKRGWIYVLDYMRHTVNTYDKNGNLIFEFGGLGLSDGWFWHPTDISVSKEGDVIVTDLFNHRVQIFKPY
ncbi:MAG: NHL repeat-containing protein [Nitrospirae bacterium]|nr:NHL repeat-containing protein [Nitrospirota bacterium]